MIYVIKDLQNLLFQKKYNEALTLWNDPTLVTPLIQQKIFLEISALNLDFKAELLSFLLKQDPSLIHSHIPEPYFGTGNALHKAILNGWDMDIEKPAFEVLVQYGIDLEFREQKPTVWQEESQFLGDHGTGRTPLLMCAWCAKNEWVSMLLDAGANPNAVDDAGLNFLDIFRAWSGKLIQEPNDAEKTLDLWLTLETGQQQMMQQYENPEHFSVFLQYYPDLTQAWLARQEHQQLQKMVEKPTSSFQRKKDFI